MKHLHSRSLFAAALSTALLFSASNVMAANPPNEPEENAQNDSSQPVTDTWITTKVKADLLATKDIPGMAIKVETVNGVVSLSGDVDSRAEADRAVAIAKGIKGVSHVNNRLMVRAGK